jgi:hypothetical protein
MKEDMKKWRERLLEEVEGELMSAFGIVLELCYYSDIPATVSSKPQHSFNAMKMFNAARAATASGLSSTTHKVVKTKGASNKKKSSVVKPPVGVLARTLHAILAAKCPDSTAAALPLMAPGSGSNYVIGDASAAIMTGKDGHFADIEGLAHVENPLFSIARAGLGILSQGLGR